MTPEAESLVRDSWRQLADHHPALAAAFYRRLFEIAPEQRELFATTDMAEQERKFTGMLAEIIRRLDLPEALVPEVAALGRRHVRYGVSAHGYALVGEALLWALASRLGPAMTPELHDAWAEAYRLTAGVMQRGAQTLPARS